MLNLSTPFTHSLLTAATVFLLASCGDAKGNPDTSEDNSYASIDCPRLDLESLDNCTHADDPSATSVDLAERADVERFCQSTCNKSATVFSLGSSGDDGLAPRNLSILKGMVEVGGIQIQQNSSSLKTLDGLESLETVEHSLRILFSPNIESLEGLSSLRRVGGDLTFQDLDKVRNLRGLSSLEQTYNLAIMENDHLTNIDAINNMEAIEHVLWIQDNPELPNCKALQLAETHGLSSDEYRISNNGAGSCE